MEFWLGWPLTGCRLTPLVSIQNPGSEKLQEGVSRALTVLVLGKKTESQTWGRNSLETLVVSSCEKNRVQDILGPDHFSPMSGTLFFFQSCNIRTTLEQTPPCLQQACLTPLNLPQRTSAFTLVLMCPLPTGLVHKVDAYPPWCLRKVQQSLTDLKHNIKGEFCFLLPLPLKSSPRP